MKRWARVACSCLTAGCALVFSACGAGDDGDLEPPVPMTDGTGVDYPVALWDRRVEGETEVLIHVNAMGDVDSAFVAKTSGYAEFDSAAVSGARRLRFTPGRRGDRRVAMWTRIPVRFAQDSSAVLGASRDAGIREE